MAKKFVYNADQKVQERLESEITIGGQMFRPRPRTSRVIQEWLSLMPEGVEEEAVEQATGRSAEEEFGTDIGAQHAQPERPEEAKGDDTPVEKLKEASAGKKARTYTRDEMLKQVELLNEQLVVLLRRDVHGDCKELVAPGLDHFNDHLDQEDAKAIMEAIAPDDEEIKEAEGNSVKGGFVRS